MNLYVKSECRDVLYRKILHCSCLSSVMSEPRSMTLDDRLELTGVKYNVTGFHLRIQSFFFPPLRAYLGSNGQLSG